MATTFPYPATEHYEPPTTPSAVLADELHYYPTKPEFTANLAVLRNRIYKDTPLLAGLRKSARLLQIGRLAAGSVRSYDAPTLALSFYDGEVMGMHAAIRSLHPQHVRQVLRWDYLVDYEEDYDTFDTNPYLQETAQDLQQIREQTWSIYFAQKDEAYQSKILSAARLLYDETSHAEQKKEDFAAGFIYAADTITVVVDPRD